MFSTSSSTSGGISLPRASTIKRKTPLIITQSGRVAKRRHRSFNNALKTTEDEDFSLKKKQTTRKDDDGNAFLFSREKVLETKATAMCLSALMVMMSFPNASFDSVEAMEISSNKETTRTTTLRTINREKATEEDKIVDVVLPPPSLSSSLSSSDDVAGRTTNARTTNAGTMLLSSEDEEDEDLNAQLAEAIRKGDASKIADIGVKLKEKEDREKQKLIEPNYVTKVQKAAPLKDEEKSVVDLFTKSKSAVVFITNVAVRRDAFTLSLTEQPQGAGSGIIWDDEGHVVTNYHVIRNANELKVQFSLQNNRGPNSKGKINDVLDACDAVVVGFDDDKDIAVLKLMDESCYTNKARALPIGSSSSLQVGQKVFAIGNPFGLDHTLTTGVVSGLSRQIQSGNTGRPIDGIIQTDAAINPGNSGGPLLNSSGQLIGLNTAIYSASGTSSGVGFALPVDMVTGIVDQIIRFGRVTRPIIGVSFAPDEIAEQLGLGGVLVLDAREGGPAERAGIRSTKRDDSGRLLLGDVIVGIDDEKIEDSYDLYRALDTHVVGDSVKVSVFRDTDRKVLDFLVKLDDIKDMKPPSTNRKIIRPNGRSPSSSSPSPGDDSSNSSSSKGLGRRGGRFEPLTPPTTR
jgi:S1-C subfamily serine protease